MKRTTIHIYLNTQVFSLASNGDPNIVDSFSDVIIDDVSALTWRRFGQDTPYPELNQIIISYQTDENIKHVQREVAKRLVELIPDVEGLVLGRAINRLFELIQIEMQTGADWHYRHSVGYFNAVHDATFGTNGSIAQIERELFGALDAL